MNTLTIVILALTAADQAISMIEGFITNQNVKKILDTVQAAIRAAVGDLQPHQVAMQDRARQGGGPVPSKSPKGENQSEPDDGAEAHA